MSTLGFPDKLDRILESNREKWRKEYNSFQRDCFIRLLLCPCRLPWIQNSQCELTDRSSGSGCMFPETGQRQWGQTDTCKAPSEHKRALTVKVIEHWSRLDKRGCEVSSCGDTQSLTTVYWATSPSWSCWSRGNKLDDLLRSLPIPTILCSCVISKIYFWKLKLLFICTHIHTSVQHQKHNSSSHHCPFPGHCLFQQQQQ